MASRAKVLKLGLRSKHQYFLSNVSDKEVSLEHELLRLVGFPLSLVFVLQVLRWIRLGLHFVAM